MQNSAAPAGLLPYRERLAPSLKIFAGAAVVAPMAALSVVPLGRVAALAIGAGAALALVALLIAAAPRVTVADGILRAGRAHIDVAHLGEPAALEGEEARRARGVDLDARGWHLIRGGIAGMVVVPNTDPDDPVTSWAISTRTPDRLAAAIRSAQIAG
ncbi:DUF3093 domain-containing protein [Microbacterium sp. gxy059]|uniref:DUF3093 domain-containing protein n=1 Tax=Microbacterium sp. gxy059 TaxID=2957199 RepID=UPI003D9942A4